MARAFHYLGYRCGLNAARKINVSPDQIPSSRRDVGLSHFCPMFRRLVCSLGFDYVNSLPYFKVYPGDWRKDLGAQSLTYHEKGVWFELRCIMHSASQRGKLVQPDGKALSGDTIARLLGLSLHDSSATIQRLIDSGVAKACPESGALTCPAMVKEESIREIRVKSGSLGGNPALVNQNGYPLGKQKRVHEYEHVPELGGEGERERKEGADQLLALVAELQAFPAYEKIDVQREAWKAAQWCAANRRNFSKRFFVNWLNKVDVPVSGAIAPGLKPMGVHELKSIIDAKQRIADEIKRKHCSEVAMGDSWTDEGKRKEFFQIKRDIKSINQRIGALA